MKVGLRWSPLLGLLWLMGCDDPPAPGPLLCRATSQCPSGYHCTVGGVCRGDQPCHDDNGCCLGERCQDGRCRERQGCSASASCLDPATVCTYGVCVPKDCQADSDCGGGRACLWGLCQNHTPCGGTCPAGQACAARLDRCVPAPAASCPAGKLAVIDSEVARMPEFCQALPISLTCRDLPPLPPGEIGWPGVLVGSGGSLTHIAYDRRYGDVVATRYAGAPPHTPAATRWLLGLPASGAVVGDPLGPRHGVAEPGPDVGRRLAAVALGQGAVALVARDASHDALIYAEWAADGSLSQHKLAAFVGIGEALALAVVGDKPAVAAFVPAAPQAAPATPARVIVWQAKQPHPTDAEHWQPVEVDSQAVAAPLAQCGGACPSGQVCAVKGPLSLCVTPSKDCSNCILEQVCSSGQCLPKAVGLAPLDGEPQGRGASLALRPLASGQLALAAYSTATRDLALYRRTGDTWSKDVIAPAQVPASAGDVGRFVQLVEGDGGELWAVCQGGDGRNLLLVRQGPGGVHSEVLDDGVRGDGLHRVGADIAAV
ncbi:MAG: hypothetical protein HY902_20875, partial [Deltaproteobacteria bacterium]|nr:hypothetical protein [Deltaproteobacteria bacterium]